MCQSDQQLYTKMTNQNKMTKSIFILYGAAPFLRSPIVCCGPCCKWLTYHTGDEIMLFEIFVYCSIEINESGAIAQLNIQMMNTQQF